MISIEEREKGVSLIEDACKAGARQEKACALLGITERTLQRWKKTPDKSIRTDQSQYNNTSPANKLSPAETRKYWRIARKYIMRLKN